MRRLLRFGCITVIVIAVLVAVLAALGSRQPQTGQPQVASENTAAPAVKEDSEPLDGPAQEPTAPPPTDAPTSAPQAEQVAATNGRCEPVPPDVVAGIESGLTVDGGGTLRGAQAVRSQDFEQVWFVAADIQGTGLEGGSDIAVWAMNDISAPGAGLTIAANAVANEFSDWGAADESQRFNPGDDGMSEAEQCVAALLQSQPDAAPLAYDVASEEIIEAPNGRTRIRQEIVIPESGPPEGVAAALADAVRQGFAKHPDAIVSVVFGYGPEDDIGSGFTRGRASASRDGKGLDPGSAQLLAGPDTGQIEIEVATEIYNDMPTETEMVYLPLE